MRSWMLALGALFALSIPACGTLSAEQEAAVIAAIDRLEQEEQITPAEAEAMRNATRNEWIGWQRLLEMLLSAGLGVLGVRVWRGPSATRGERLARLAARSTGVDAGASGG